MPTFIEDQKFEKVDYTQDPLSIGEYENCQFINCNFANTDLSDIYFSDCHFTGCNMGMVKLLKTTFSNARFKDCKLLGLHFEDCNAVLFTVDFEKCILDLSSFYKLKIKKTRFKDSSLREVDLTEADLTGCTLDNCDLWQATFDNTVIEKADLRTSYNYSIDPLNNKIRKAKFSKEGVSGLLDKFDIEIE